MEYDLKTLLGIVAALVAVVNYLPYLIGVIRQTLHPHAFSWIIWTVMTSIVFFAQLTDGAGTGAWATGATAITLFLVACFAVRNGGYRITRSDKLSFTGALAAIPVWVITSDPLWAVVILTTIEVLGFFPTYRKAFSHPFDESVLAFSLTIVKYALALGAMQNYTLTTTLFPIALIVLSTLLIIELVWRKRVVKK
ncbi:hypothetical protein CL655_03555 [bacterium]|nr:hypothetical protein [bacterium]|tara:strand:+ start:2122 stop:2706 length:585 start_codon:yes stop_codon:yes gene_type:complete